MRRGESGIILASVMWTMILLSLMALAIGRLTGGQVWFVSDAVSRVKAYAAARSGMTYALNMLAHAEAKCPSLYACGFDPGDEKPETFFKKVSTGDRAHADICYVTRGYSKDGSSRIVYGFSDEDRRFNLNRINVNNADKILADLLTQAGMPANQAAAVSVCAATWITDANGSTASAKQKQKSFDRVDELLVCDGMTVDVLNKVREYLTVYPKDSSETANSNPVSASNAVLRADNAASFAPAAGGTSPDEATRQQIAARDGADGEPFTADDGKSIVQNDVKNFWRVRVVGVDENSGIKAVIEAVVEKKDANRWPKIWEWHRE
ncbi:MAG: general secretion pathway protein GspK [Candidatus Omnitrophica bacterium]|nr:general secretion pathway protein GspK [Candidatus Omnitrophota bacterium]